MKCWKECPLFDEESVDCSPKPNPWFPVYIQPRFKEANTCSFYRDKECTMADLLNFMEYAHEQGGGSQMTPYEGD